MPNLIWMWTTAKGKGVDTAGAPVVVDVESCSYMALTFDFANMLVSDGSLDENKKLIYYKRDKIPKEWEFFEMKLIKMDIVN